LKAGRAATRVRQHLQRALEGTRPVRRFKDAIAAHPDVEERWFAYRDAGYAAGCSNGWSRKISSCSKNS
jgi:hypothetical protein